MKLDGKQKQTLHNALFSAFPTRGGLSQMMAFQMEESLEKVAGGENYSELLLNLIQWAESQGLLQKLILGARGQNPGNEDLFAFAVQLGLESPQEKPQPEKKDVKPDHTEPSSLQRTIYASGGGVAIDIEELGDLYRQVRQASRAVCRIEAYQSMATGFLVGPDVVMTAYFTVKNLIENASYVDPVTREETSLQPSNIKFRFGYFRLPTSPITNAGEVYSLAPDWHIASSPIDELDFALLRIHGAAGHDRIYMEQGEIERGRVKVTVGHDGIYMEEREIERGWVKFAATPSLVAGSDLYILHHPHAMPLKLSCGSLLGSSEDQTRCSYNLFTEPGSSGAPIFSADWELVAFHEKREGSGAHDVKSGVLVSEIMKRPNVRAVLDP